MLDLYMAGLGELAIYYVFNIDFTAQLNPTGIEACGGILTLTP